MYTCKYVIHMWVFICSYIIVQKEEHMDSKIHAVVPQQFWWINDTGTRIWGSSGEICGLNVNAVKSSQRSWVSVISPVWLQDDAAVVRGADHNTLPDEAGR